MLLANRNIVVSLPVLKKSQENELEQAVLRFQNVAENVGRRLTFADFRIFEDEFAVWQLTVAGSTVASSTHEGPLKVLAATLKNSAQVEQSHANELRIQEVPENQYYVDIPTPDCIKNDDGAFKNVGQFATKAEAIKFAREHFGADEDGKVQLVVG